MPGLTNTKLGAADKAYAWLQEQITRTPWDHEIFFSENTLAEATGVSRAPVREALLRLEARDLLKRVPHKGAYIPALTMRDLDEHIEVRTLIGDWATRKVAEKHLIDSDYLHGLVDEQSKHLDDLLAFIEADHGFHLAIVKAAGNGTFTAVYESQTLIQKRLGLHAVAKNDGRLTDIVDEHRAMADAIASGDPEIASQVNLAHLDKTAKAMQTDLT